MDRRWWQGATLYQLYVRSWQDSDDDGYGDLRGIIARLDYLEWLGVDGIWLSPTMPSPDADWGYDVSDYRGVHPELGTMADLDELIAAAGGRGMRVLLDLVPNHTSSAHPWFVESASSRQSPLRDYYVWADPAPGGGPPNNWLDFTGHPAWQWDERSGQFYLHNFLPAQPDLNWWQPAVHEEFRQILRFWFDRGVAGFRIDVAHGLYKDALLRDNPPAESDGPLAGRFGLRSEYNENRPEVHAVYRDWRAIADRYAPPRLLLGETWVGELGQLAAFYGADDELQLAFNFPFVFAELRRRRPRGGRGKHARRAAGGRVPGLDRVQPRRRPLPEPLVRRGRSDDQARAAGARYPARCAGAVLRRRDRHDRRHRPARARQGYSRRRERQAGPGPGQDADAVGRLAERGVHRRRSSRLAAVRGCGGS